jgi:disulfide bond formation protein DsbB
MISHLRGVELFVLHAACAQCWLVALCALVAGVGPLVHTLASQSRPGRAVSLTALVVAMGGGFFAASLLPKPPPPVEPAEIEIPGWQLVLPTTDPADSAEFLLCEPGQPNLLLVIDPECPDCRDLINGLLAEEHVQLYLQDCCRVATIFDNVVTSPFMDGISTTPALLLLSDDGEVVERVVGHIGEDEILALLDSAYQMM